MGKNYRLVAIAIGVNLRQNTRENSRFQVIPGNVLKDYKVYVKSSTSIPGTKLPPSWRLSYVPTSGMNS